MQPWGRPFLRWAGSKRQLVPTLAEHLNCGSGRYVEPFAGSACLFFATRPASAVLGDRNEPLIDTYRAVRAHPRLVARALHRIPTDKDSYYSVRAAPEPDDTVERAARFIYLNRLAFNGLYRTNRNGRFNVPYGSRSGAMPSEAHLHRCSVALRGADLRCGDFEEILADAAPGDFVYLDPPYTQQPERAYGVYGYGSFDSRDFERMIECLQALDKKDVGFLFSYASVPSVAEALPRKWSVAEVQTRGQIAANTAARSARSEVLITNTTSLP